MYICLQQLLVRHTGKSNISYATHLEKDVVDERETHEIVCTSPVLIQFL